MSDLADIIARLEKATGPDRELDFLIFEAVAFPEDYFGSKIESWSLSRGAGYTVNTADGIRHLSAFNAPAYTASIDAALTLVPEGFAWKVGTCCVSDDAWVTPDYNSPVHGRRLRREYGEPKKGSIWDNGIDIDQRPSGRPAIALCIAALRARMAQ